MSRTVFLSFTIENDGKMIQIHANQAGIDELVTALQRSKEKGHLHLWSSEAGGFLSDRDPWGAEAITDVSITTDESNLRKPSG